MIRVEISDVQVEGRDTVKHANQALYEEAVADALLNSLTACGTGN